MLIITKCCNGWKSHSRAQISNWYIYISIFHVFEVRIRWSGPRVHRIFGNEALPSYQKFDAPEGRITLSVPRKHLNDTFSYITLLLKCILLLILAENVVLWWRQRALLFGVGSDVIEVDGQLNDVLGLIAAISAEKMLFRGILRVAG